MSGLRYPIHLCRIDPGCHESQGTMPHPGHAAHLTYAGSKEPHPLRRLARKSSKVPIPGRASVSTRSKRTSERAACAHMMRDADTLQPGVGDHLADFSNSIVLLTTGRVPDSEVRSKRQ